MADFGFMTLVANFVLRTLVTDFGLRTLVADFGFWTMVANFYSTNLFFFSLHHVPTNSIAPFYAYKPTLSLRLGTI